MSSGITLAPQALASVELLVGLSTTALEKVAASARFRRLTKETQIFQQGDPAERTMR